MKGEDLPGLMDNAVYCQHQHGSVINQPAASGAWLLASHFCMRFPAPMTLTPDFRLLPTACAALAVCTLVAGPVQAAPVQLPSALLPTAPGNAPQASPQADAQAREALEQAQQAAAQEVATVSDEPGLQLKLDTQLSLPHTLWAAAGKDVTAQAAQLVHLEGDVLEGVAGENVVLRGDAQLRSPQMVVKADALEYRQSDGKARAQGNVRIYKEGNLFTGQKLEIDAQTQQGYMLAPTYRFAVTNGAGQAERIDFQDKDHASVRNANYTTCNTAPMCTPANPEGRVCDGVSKSGKPAWELRAAQVDFDNVNEVGLAKNVQLRFMDVPILASPVLSFPLTDKRKTGLLPPSIAIENTSGLSYTQPVYWNIAPQMDATFYPTLMSKRGLNVGSELRYLGQRYNGQVQLDLMPDDRLRKRQRWGFAAGHSHNLYQHSQGAASLNLSVTVKRVSDGNYWRDFSNGRSGLSERILPTEWLLDYQREGFYARARTLKWQTQQVPESVITPPYDRMPSLTVGWRKDQVRGFNYLVEVDRTKFESDTVLNQQPNGLRTLARAQVSYPIRQAGWFVVPKVHMLARSYRFDTPLSNGTRTRSVQTGTLSVDAGMVFERNAQIFQRNYVQTLEPRAFYTYTPYREQNDLPNYDSGLNDFNFASIYTENAFNGSDRIADNNLLTLGVQSRLIRPADGAELLRLAYAQRLRYAQRRVVLPGGRPEGTGVSDMLFGANANLSKRWSADALVQYNPKTRHSERSTLGLRYHPTDYRTVSLAHRYQRDQSEQLDLGWQWPLSDLWGPKAQPLGAGAGLGAGQLYSVGRVNYSMRDRRVADALLGLEYDGDCWIGRVALERQQNAGNRATQRVLFQLEFVGFSRLGSSPLKTLQDTIPRYQLLREKDFKASRAPLVYE